MKRVLYLFIMYWLYAGCLFAQSKKQPLKLRPDNIEEVLYAMTRREKVKLLVGNGWGSLFSGIGIPMTDGIVPGAAGQTRAIKRLGITPIVMADGPAGLRLHHDIFTTRFPCGTSLASTGDTALIARVGRAMAEEARLHDVDIILSPGMNIMRHPLCGRNYEYYSEDPLVTAQTATAMVRGIQRMGIGACVKHFACNNQETNRMKNDAVVDETTLRQLYLEAFRLTVRDAQPWTLMSSYNKLNGTGTQQHQWLLHDVLRGEWGYQGVVMTDWIGVRNSVAQVAATNDLLMPGMKRQRWQLRRALRKGKLSEEVVDSCVRRMLTLVTKTQRFLNQQDLAEDSKGRSIKDAKHKNNKETSSDSLLRQHALLAREAAAKGMVLLENHDHLIPLNLRNQRVALYGATSYEMIAGGTGSGHVNSRYVVNMNTALRYAGAKVDSSLESFYLNYLKQRGSHHKSSFYLSKYMGKAGPKETPIEEEMILQRVAETDVAIITIGRQAGEGKDREVEGEFTLTSNESELIRKVSEAYHNANKRVIVVLNVTGPIEIASWRDMADAILVAWLPGQEAGNAVCDILSGRIPATGRLTMTWPISIDDLPSSANFPTTSKGSRKQTIYSEGLDVGHHYFDRTHKSVAYPFGWKSK